MYKINLQMYAEEETKKAVHGQRLVYLYRVLKNAATKSATNIAFVTENELSKSKDSDSTATKDGPLMTPGEVEVELSSTSLLPVDEGIVEDLEDALDNNDIIEIWEANLDRPVEDGSNKFKGRYMQGYLTEFTKSSSAEDYVEVELTFGINGSGVKGDVTVSAEQQAIAALVFKDTQAETGA